MAHLIVVYRDKEKLELHRARAIGGWKLVKTYRCAVGMQGLETPQGRYSILNKSRHPDYRYPSHSEWVPPELRGVLVPFGDPANPIAGRWMGITEDGVGIHGTWDRDSIGSAASHGCVRLLIEDVVQLYNHAPRGTLVFIY